MKRAIAAIVLLLSLTSVVSAETAVELEVRYENERMAILDSDWESGISSEARSFVAPDGFSARYGSCDGPEGCGLNQVLFGFELPFAYQGHYQSQRNIAYCLIDGCNNSIFPNLELGCAWRIVILASGSPQIDASDRSNLEWCFEYLDPIGYATMRSMASNLYSTVYGKLIDPAWLAP